MLYSPHVEINSRVQAQGSFCFWSGSSQEVVEYVVGSLLGKLGAYAGLLQQVVRDVASHHLELQREIQT